MKRDLIKRLRKFKRGDLIERMELIEALNPHFDEIIGRKKSSSPLFLKLKSYMNELPYETRIDDFFHLLGDFLCLLYIKKAAPSPENRENEVLDVVGNLIRLMRGRKVEIVDPVIITEDVEDEEPESSSVFSRADEENLDYGNVVTDESMMATYVDEVKEFLDSAQAGLLDLEHDENNEEAINRVFRCFHTVKSSSALLGFKNLEVLSHHMENMLGKVRDRELIVGPELIDVIFHGVGIIRDLIQVLEQCGSSKACIVDGFQSYTLAPYIQLVEKITRDFKKKKLGEILRDMGTIDDSTLQALLKKQSEKEGAVFGQLALEEKAVKKEDLDRALQEQSRSRSTASFVRVSSSRLSALVDMVGELVVNQSMLKQKILRGGDSLSENDINQLAEVTSSLKELVLSMGMISLRDMFQKLRVVVRNAARDLNKVVSFDIQGEETEMDRSLVEAIYDPLVHMVRNSVSHGIEGYEERLASGKPEVGKIAVTAEYRGNGVEISVRDDGRGINPERIVDKAIALGWIESSKRNAYIRDEAFVFSLLYRPGFSTKDQADSISGRGVGMDVVMQNISRINGKVEIQSEVGKGSLFRIKLPLTLAIIDGFVTEIMEEFYVIPFEAVEEILVNTELNLVPSEEEEVMGESRGKYFPVVDVFKILTGVPGVYRGNFVYVLIKHDNTEFAIPVNRVLGKQEIVIKNLNEVTRRQKLFYGGTIFGDGSIGFILDMEEIIAFHKLTDNSRPVAGHLEDTHEK